MQTTAKITINVNRKAIRERLSPYPHYMRHGHRIIRDADIDDYLAFLGMEPTNDPAAWHGDDGALACLFTDEIESVRRW